MVEKNRDGFFPLAFASGILRPYEDLTIHTRRLGDYEIYHSNELFVPSHLLGNGVLVTSFGVEREDSCAELLLSEDPVPLDAFEKYVIETFKIHPKERAFIMLRSIVQCDLSIALALRGLYHGRGDG